MVFMSLVSFGGRNKKQKFEATDVDTLKKKVLEVFSLTEGHVTYYDSDFEEWVEIDAITDVPKKVKFKIEGTVPSSTPTETKQPSVNVTKESFSTVKLTPLVHLEGTTVNKSENPGIYISKFGTGMPEERTMSNRKGLYFNGKYNDHDVGIFFPPFDKVEFTAVINFLFKPLKDNIMGYTILAGGRGWRWFVLGVNRESQELEVTFNNQDVIYSTNLLVPSDEYCSLAISVNCTTGKILLLLNDQEATVDINPLSPKGIEQDANFCFTNYSRGIAFSGLLTQLYIASGAPFESLNQLNHVRTHAFTNTSGVFKVNGSNSIAKTTIEQPKTTAPTSTTSTTTSLETSTTTTTTTNTPTNTAIESDGKDLAAFLTTDTVLDKAGQTYSVASIASQYEEIAIYLSAKWCTYCKSFTNKLSDMYSMSHDREVIFVSCDRSQSQFDAYFDTMPFKAVPYSVGSQLSRKIGPEFGISGIPTLLIIDRHGRLISKDGVKKVQDENSI